MNVFPLQMNLADISTGRAHFQDPANICWQQDRIRCSLQVAGPRWSTAILRSVNTASATRPHQIGLRSSRSPAAT